MKPKGKLEWTLVSVIAGMMLIVAVLFSMRANTSTYKWFAMSPNAMQANGKTISIVQEVLNNEATSTVTTGLGWVQGCVATVDTFAGATPPNTVLCEIPSQTSTNRGKVDVQADTVGGTAAGSTTVTIAVFGQGTR